MILLLNTAGRRSAEPGGEPSPDLARRLCDEEWDIAARSRCTLLPRGHFGRNARFGAEVHPGGRSERRQHRAPAPRAGAGSRPGARLAPGDQVGVQLTSQVRQGHARACPTLASPTARRLTPPRRRGRRRAAHRDRPSTGRPAPRARPLGPHPRPRRLQRRRPRRAGQLQPRPPTTTPYARLRARHDRVHLSPRIRRFRPGGRSTAPAPPPSSTPSPSTAAVRPGAHAP